MPQTAHPPHTTQQIAQLLAQPTAVAQSHFLQQANLWHEAGLAQLITSGEWLINRNLPQARQLFDLCLTFAPELAPHLAPQAIYLRAQTFALNGDLEQALAEIAQAQTGYEQTGQIAAALRSNVGRLNVLIHLGRYAEALEVASASLAAIAQTSTLPPETATQLTALIKHNQGICYKFMGRYDDAFFAYSAAENSWQALGQADEAATIRMNLGVILAELGRGSEALAAYEQAAATFAQTDNQLRLAQNLENMGELHLWLGSYNQSLAAFAQARELFVALDAPLELHILERLTADAYLALNLLPEAAAAYRTAVAGLQASDITYHLGWAYWGLGATLLRRQRWAEAAQALEQAAAIFAEAGNDHLHSAVLLEQAALAKAQGSHETAVAQTRQALALIRQQTWPVQQIYANLRLADLLLPDTAVMELLLDEALELVEALPLPNLRFRVQHRLGQLYLLQDREAEAEAMLLKAVGEIERLRGTLARQTVRASFLGDKTAVYEDLTRLYLARGDQASLQQAFNVAEQAKSRALLDLLNNELDAQLGQTMPEDLRQQLQNLQADLHAIYNEALRDSAEGDRAIHLAGLNQRATQLEEEISRLRLQTNDPATASSLTQTIPLATLQQTLPANTTLLAYHLLGDELLAFVVQKDSLHLVRHLSQTAVIAQHLAALEIEWQRFQADPAFIQRHLPRLTRSVQQRLHALHQVLIAPLAGFWADTPHLTIIPHGLLHQLPFAALYNGRSYLIDQFELTIAPSAAILHLNQQRPAPPTGDTAIFGVADSLIPFALEEATAVSHYVTNPQLFLGEHATLANIQRHTANCRLLHLACHGLFRRDNPFFSALKLQDGWLTANDAMQLRLTGAFVTLSACESGRSQVVGGDELLGLSHAFLGAGAVGLLVSLWLVEDQSTASLMTRFYDQLNQGDSYAAALRQAQLSLKESHPHPYYWAPFTLIGG